MAKKLLLVFVSFGLVAEGTKELTLKEIVVTQPKVAAQMAAYIQVAQDDPDANKLQSVIVNVPKVVNEPDYMSKILGKLPPLQKVDCCCKVCGCFLYLVAAPTLMGTSLCFCHTPQFWPIMGPGIASWLTGSCVLGKILVDGDLC